LSEIKNFLLEKKYHPSKLEDVILPKRIKEVLQGVVDSGNISGFVFSGPAGCGKTTSAEAICNDVGVEYQLIEASVNNGVDFVRGPLLEMAQGATQGAYSAIILDEADYMSNSAQSALRNVINVTQDYCRWILTANYPQKIIPSIRGSRLTEISFSMSKDERIKEVAGLLWNRIVMICKAEGYQIEDARELQKWMVSQLPNVRAILKMIQLYGQRDGIIPAEISLLNSEITVEGFKKVLKSSYADIVKFVYATPQEDIMQFVLDNAESLVCLNEVGQLMSVTATFQQASKGIEEIYTVSYLMNLKTIVK